LHAVPVSFRDIAGAFENESLAMECVEPQSAFNDQRAPLFRALHDLGGTTSITLQPCLKLLE
jgi:hypothetical protein